MGRKLIGVSLHVKQEPPRKRGGFFYAQCCAPSFWGGPAEAQQAKRLSRQGHKKPRLPGASGVKRRERRRLGLRALLVGAVGGVDDDLFTQFNEEGDANFSAGFNGGRLQRVGRRVAFDAGLGVGYFENDCLGNFNAQSAVLVGVKEHHALHAILQEVGGVDEFFGHGDLLVGIHVHEVVAVRIVVEELVGAVLDVDVVEFGATGESMFEDTAVVEVAHFGTHKRSTLAGFNVQKFDDLIGGMIVRDAQAVLDV